MAGQRQADGRTDEQEGIGKALKRRGILAAAGAAVAAIVAKQVSQPVAAHDQIWTMPYATSTSLDGVLLFSISNPAPGAGAIAGNADHGTAVDARSLYGTCVRAVSDSGMGVDSFSFNGTGVYGKSEISFGVHGQSSGNGSSKAIYGHHRYDGYGVYGDAGTGGYGVTGVSTNAFGVLGQSDSGVAVQGQILATTVAPAAPNTAANTIAVRGLNSATGAGGIGVRGQIPSTSGAAGTIAVYGENLSSNTGGSPGNGGFGVYGYSLKGNGLLGATGTAGGAAVVGATNGVAGAYAAIFYGPVAITGGKSAAIRNDDGSHSLLYCVESPESWFEDFGEGTLTNGRAEIKIDPQFAKVAEMGKYHVFITEHDQHNDLHVTRRTGGGFAVEADTATVAAKGKKASDLTGTFSYRVVAKRKDIKAERFAKVQLPPEPQRPPSPPDPPTKKP